MRIPFKYIIPFAVFFALISFWWKGVGMGIKDLQDKPSSQASSETSTELTQLVESTKDEKDGEASISPPNPRRTFALPTVLEPSKTVTEAIFKGHVTVLNSWASWCGACRKEHDLLLSLSKETGVYWVGLNLGDNLKEAQRMLHLYGNPYHETIFDQKSQLANGFGLRGTPEFLILDKEGRVQHRHSGMINEAIWQDELLPVIQSLQ